MNIESILITAGLLLLVSTLSSKVSGKYGVPSLLIFLAIGMIAGSEGFGGIPFDDYRVARFIGVVALALILFSGGLDTEWARVRPALGRGLLLATLGVGITAAITGLAASQILGISIVEGLLLGAIVSSTDAAAVLSILRTGNLELEGDLQPLLELESGSNDPMAVFLTAALIQLIIAPATGLGILSIEFVIEMALGGSAGYLIGRLGIWMINTVRLEIEGLYPVLMLSLAIISYALTARVGGNGFLAVYVAGLVIGSGKIAFGRSLARFHDGLAWLMQIIMFLALGLLVYPTRLVSVADKGLSIAAVLIFVARPIAVFVSLAFTKMTARQKLFVSWVGLRGAVPIVLATFPLLAGVPRASVLFDIVFFIVFVSVLLQGTTIPLVARWLRLGRPAEVRPRSPIEFDRPPESTADLIEAILPHGSPAANRSIVDLGLPDETLIVLLNRGGTFVIVRGDTVLQEGDVLMILADEGSLPAVRQTLGL